MKFLPIVWRNLLRRKFRTFFTIGAIFFAFLLFGVLMAIRAAFSMGVDMAGQGRLMVIDKVSIINPLPASLRKSDPAGPGRDRHHPRELVRWLLPGRQESVRHVRGRSGELAARLLEGVRHPRGSEESVVRRSHRRDCRHRHREEVRLQGRSARPDSRHRSTAAQTAARGSSPSTASTTRRSRAPTRPT